MSSRKCEIWGFLMYYMRKLKEWIPLLYMPHLAQIDTVICHLLHFVRGLFFMSNKGPCEVREVYHTSIIPFHIRHVSNMCSDSGMSKYNFWSQQAIIYLILIRNWQYITLWSTIVCLFDGILQSAFSVALVDIERWPAAQLCDLGWIRLKL